MPTLSIAMIVRDEADKLAACLDAARQVADEIVIVDTGSVDNTTEIAKQYTPSVYSLAWNENFSEARNFAIEKAAGDWCLTLDADEVILDPDTASKQLQQFMHQHSPTTLGTVEILSRIDPEDESSISREIINRLFHRASFRYQGPIHEHLVATITDTISSETTGLRIDHSGYLHSTDASNHKSRRNIPLLEKAIETNPEDEYYLFQLGQAHFTTKSWQAAIDAFEKAEAAIDFSSTPPAGSQGPVSREVLTSIITSLCYSYINVGATDKAQELMSRHLAKGHPGTQRADFAHALGYLFFMSGNLQEAINAYQLSLQFGPENEDVLGTGSYSSHYHLGLLWESNNDPIRAMEHYATAIQINASYRPAISRCIGFIVDYKTLLPPDLFKLAAPEHWQAALVEKHQQLQSADMEDAERQQCVDLLKQTAESQGFTL